MDGEGQREERTGSLPALFRWLPAQGVPHRRAGMRFTDRSDAETHGGAGMWLFPRNPRVLHAILF